MEQIGPYRIVREIARGGMGAVFHGRGPQGNEVAIKLLLAQRAENPLARQRFQLEIRTLAKLRHPNVVSIISVGEHEGVPWLALEYVAGDTLHNRLREGPLSIDASVELARQVAQALAYVHGCGVLHRDLKPDNLLLQGERVLLTDFGLSREDDTSQSRFTATGIFLGTPGYWSPEQARVTRHEPGPHTDLFGLGAVLYACLTGSPPIRASSLSEHLEAERFHRIVPPHRQRPDVPRWLSKLCMRCLAFEPRDRPASAEDVARALLLGEHPDRNEPAAEGRPTPAFLILVALAAVGLTTLTGYAVWRNATTSDAPLQPRVDHVAPVPELEPQPPDPPRPQPDLRTGVTDPAEVEELDALAERARQLNSEGRLEEAIELFDRILARVPAHADSYLKRGAAKSALERFDEALLDIDHAIELDPGDADAYLARGGDEYRQGHIEAALADYDRGLQIDPSHTSLLYVRALSNGTAGRNAEVIADLTRLLSIEPNHVDGLRRRAKAFGALGRFEETIADFDRLLQLNPREAISFAARGYAKSELKRYAEAVTDYSRALELDPSLVGAYVDRAVARKKIGEQREALADYTQALALDPNHERALLGRSMLRDTLGLHAGVIEDLDRLLVVAPRHHRAHTQRGLAKFRLERLVEAIADFDLALELDPRDVVASVNRGMCHFKLGRYREALAAYDRVLEAKLLSGSEAAQVVKLREDALAKLRE